MLQLNHVLNLEENTLIGSKKMDGSFSSSEIEKLKLF